MRRHHPRRGLQQRLPAARCPQRRQQPRRSRAPTREFWVDTAFGDTFMPTPGICAPPRSAAPAAARHPDRQHGILAEVHGICARRSRT